MFHVCPQKICNEVWCNGLLLLKRHVHMQTGELSDVVIIFFQ